VGIPTAPRAKPWRAGKLVGMLLAKGKILFRVLGLAADVPGLLWRRHAQG